MFHTQSLLLTGIGNGICLLAAENIRSLELIMSSSSPRHLRGCSSLHFLHPLNIVSDSRPFIDSIPTKLQNPLLPETTNSGSDDIRPITNGEATASENDNNNVMNNIFHQPREEDEIYYSQKTLFFASIMALLAGISDAICLHRFKCFATMMTGNTIFMSVSLAEHRLHDALWRASLIGCYFIGAVGIQSTNESSIQWTIPVVAGIFSAAEYLLIYHNERWQKCAIFILGLGYGMLYTYAYHELDQSSSDAITGHVMMLGGNLADFFRGALLNSMQMTLSACVFVSLATGCYVGHRLVCMLKPTSFPYFALLGIAYALVLTIYMS